MDASELQGMFIEHVVAQYELKVLTGLDDDLAQGLVEGLRETLNDLTVDDLAMYLAPFAQFPERTIDQLGDISLGSGYVRVGDSEREYAKTAVPTKVFIYLAGRAGEDVPLATLDALLLSSKSWNAISTLVQVERMIGPSETHELVRSYSYCSLRKKN
jgi:hypothetical protein